MAYTIVTQPNVAGANPAFNPLVYILSSTNFASPQHKFVAIVKNEAGGIIQRLEFVPPPLFANAYIDISRLVSNYVKYDMDFGILKPTITRNSIYRFTIEFGERYSGTDYLNLVSAVLIVNNFALDKYEYLSYSYASYLSKFVSKNTSQLYINSNYWLNFYHSNAAAVGKIRVTANNGVTDTISEIRNDHTTFASWTQGYIYFPSGQNMNLIITADLISGTAGNVLPADTKRITYEIMSGATVLDTHVVNIINSCVSNYELYYLTEKGTFDTIIMPNGFKKEFEFKRQSVKRLASSMQSSSFYGYNSFSAQNVDRSIMFQNKWTLRTDWLTDTQSQNLFDLIASSVVFLKDNGINKRVMVTMNNYEEKVVKFKKLFNFELMIMESLENERQWVS